MNVANFLINQSHKSKPLTEVVEYHLTNFREQSMYTEVHDLKRYLAGFEAKANEAFTPHKAYWEAKAEACRQYIKERETERLLLGE